MTLIPSRKTFPLAQHTHTKIVDLDNLKNTQHFLAYHTTVYTKYRRITLLTEWTEINTNEILFHSLLIKASSKQSLTLESKISEKLKSIFLWLNLSCCLLQKISKLFIAFKEWPKHLKQERIQLQNHLKLIQHTKQFSVMIWKQTTGWICESIGCFGLTASQTPKTVFYLFQNT